MPERRRPRVAFLIRDLDIGGAQRQLVELASGMQRAGWPVSVYTFYGGGGLEADLRARGVAVHVLDKHGRWDTVGFWFRLLRAMRKARPDILHSYLGSENILGVSLRPFLGRTPTGLGCSGLQHGLSPVWLAPEDLLSRGVSAGQVRRSDHLQLSSRNGTSVPRTVTRETDGRDPERHRQRAIQAG